MFLESSLHSPTQTQLSSQMPTQMSILNVSAWKDVGVVCFNAGTLCLLCAFPLQWSENTRKACRRWTQIDGFHSALHSKWIKGSELELVIERHSVERSKVEHFCTCQWLRGACQGWMARRGKGGTIPTPPVMKGTLTQITQDWWLCAHIRTDVSGFVSCFSMFTPMWYAEGKTGIGNVYYLLRWCVGVFHSMGVMPDMWNTQSCKCEWCRRKVSFHMNCNPFCSPGSFRHRCQILSAYCLQNIDLWMDRFLSFSLFLLGLVLLFSCPVLWSFTSVHKSTFTSVYVLTFDMGMVFTDCCSPNGHNCH